MGPRRPRRLAASTGFVALAALAVMWAVGSAPGCGSGDSTTGGGDPDATGGGDEDTPSACACTVDSDCGAAAECAAWRCEACYCVPDVADGDACDDGDPCTAGDSCDAGGVCVGGELVICPDTDGNPCTNPACSAEVGRAEDGFCVEWPISTDGVVEGECTTYACADGSLTDQADLGVCAAVAPEGGCVATWTCDPGWVDPDNGTHCRPIYKQNGARCRDEDTATWAVTSSTPTTATAPSACDLYVCYQPDADSASTCTLASDLEAGAADAIDLEVHDLAHTCEAGPFEAAGIPLACNDITCQCQAADCLDLECAVQPALGLEGLPCPSDDACDGSTCQWDGLTNKTFVCAPPEPGFTEPCDLFADATCDVAAGPCDPVTGCPLELDAAASNVACLGFSPCADPVTTVCDPNSPAADPVTGCVVVMLEEGADCSHLFGACVEAAACQATDAGALACVVTDTFECPDQPCQVGTCQAGQCTYAPVPAGACDDDVACTLDDQCVDGACSGTPDDGACDDGDECTADSCSAAGCKNPPITGCPSAVCVLTGDAEDVVTCELLLARQTAAVEPAVALGFALSWDASALTLATFKDEVCVPGGECFVAEFPATNTIQPSGHTLKIAPADYADWAGFGGLTLSHASAPKTAINDVVHLSADFDPEAAHFLTVDFVLVEAAGPQAPHLVTASQITGASATPKPLGGGVSDHVIELCAALECTADNCGPEPIDDPCLGVPVACPCDGLECPEDVDCGPDSALPLHSGDANDDGARNVVDVILFIDAALQGIAGGDDNGEQAFDDVWIDLDCDGQLNIVDVQIAILYVLAALGGGPPETALDLDGDFLTHACDFDDDGDGWWDLCEVMLGTEPLDATSVPAPGAVCECPEPCAP